MTPDERSDGRILGGDAEVNAAFDDVLAAERAAEEAVAACRAEAEQCQAQVEAVARVLSERVRTRCRLWRERHVTETARKITAVQRQAAEAAEPITLDAPARARLAVAVERLADELCGAAGKAG